MKIPAMCLYAPNTSAPLARLHRHKHTAFNPNGVGFKTSLGSQVVRIEDHRSEVLSCNFNTAGNLFLTSNKDGEIHMCTTIGRREVMLKMKDHLGPVMDAVFSYEETCIYSCSADKTLGIWDSQMGLRCATLKGHTDVVNSVQRSRCPYPLICSGSKDGTVRIWDARGLESMITLNSGSEVNAACFSDNSEHIFTAGNDMDIKIWDIRRETISARLRGHTAPVKGLALSPCGQYLLSHGSDNMLRIWDVKPYTSGDRCKMSFSSNQNSAAEGLLRCAWSGDGKWVSAGTAGRDVCIWDANTGEKLHAIPGHQAYVNDVAFHPRESFILSASNDKVVFLNEI